MKEKMKPEPFTIERTYDAPVEKVWQAITDREQMKKWYFDIPEFRPEVGVEFQFDAGDQNDKIYRHLCRITEVVERKKLTYSWQYADTEGLSHVTFELFEEGNVTRLKLTHEGLETFPADKPAFARENFVRGWTEIIGTNLKNFVEN